MSIVRLLATGLALFAIACYAQDLSNSAPKVEPTLSPSQFVPGSQRAPIPLRPVPADPVSRMEQNFSKFRVMPTQRSSAISIAPGSETDKAAVSLDDIATDSSCYAIRSYVVARDRKNSDSTHPVAYSTCQPASRYRLRTTLQVSNP
jgi:hypothetical protein